MIKRALNGLLIGLVAALLASGLWLAGWLDTWERSSWGVRVRTFARPLPSTDQIKIILIDQASLDWAAKENGLQWPWIRQAYTPILDFLRRGGAKVILFDMLYTEPSAHGVDDDELFGASIGAQRDFVGAFFTGETTEQALQWPAAIPRRAWELAGLDAWLTPARRKALEDSAAAFPVPQVATAATALATIRLEPDADGVFRRIAPFRLFDGGVVPTLGLMAYLLGRDEPPALAVRDRVLTIGDIEVPIDAKGRVVLRYRGPTGTHQAFGAAGVIQSELRLQAGEAPNIDPEVFRGKYVFLGASAPGLKDLKPAPVDGDYPGVELHATLLDNLLARDAIRDPPRAAVLALVFALSLAAALAITLVSGSWKNVGLFVLFLPVPFVVGAWAYQAGQWWPVLVTVMGTGFSLVGGVLVNYATEGRQKRFIKSAFKQYLGETVIDQMIADPSKLSLGGERKELTMFFSDLEKFSSFSEKLEPPQLIDLLNVYLTDMGRVLMEEGGYIDKYIGDAIVVFWNAPLPQPDHAVRAIRAALRCQQVLRARQAVLSAKAAGMPVRMRIGLNTGDVVIGNMGSQERFNYTMLGDAANLASRLEGANKAFGTFILVSESTWAAANHAVFGRELGALQVVGRKKPVRVYEPLALRREDLPAWLPDYEAGLRAVAEKRWADALALFGKLPDDPPAQAYVRKLRALDGADWDGVWSLTEK